ncbi:MAG: hypothetical protein ACRD5G_13275, partial [Candidatus Acidiferrales bacterium]
MRIGGIHICTLLCMLVMAILLVVMLAEGQAPSLPKPGPEMARLDFLVGAWQYTETYEAGTMGPAGSGKGTMTVRRGPGGLSLLIDWKTSSSARGETSGHDIYAWDAKAGAYQLIAVSNETAAASIFSGRWEGQDFVVEGTFETPAGPMAVRAVWSDIQPRSV